MLSSHTGTARGHIWHGSVMDRRIIADAWQHNGEPFHCYYIFNARDASLRIDRNYPDNRLRYRFIDGGDKMMRWKKINILHVNIALYIIWFIIVFTCWIYMCVGVVYIYKFFRLYHAIFLNIDRLLISSMISTLRYLTSKILSLGLDLRPI